MLSLIIIAICLAVYLLPLVAKILAHIDYVFLILIVFVFTGIQMSWHTVFVILSIVGAVAAYAFLLNLRLFNIHVFKILISIPIVVYTSHMITYSFSPDLIWRIFNFVLLTGVLLYVRFKDNPVYESS